MNDPEKIPSYNDPVPTDYEKGAYPPDAFPQLNSDLAPASSVAPPVIGWYKFYAAFMVFLYLMCMVGGIALLMYSNTILASAPQITPAELKIRAVITAVIGIVLFVAFIVALVLPKSPGAWVYHLVMIAIGLTSCCFWPVTIPMMIAWMKPETQRWFGRMDAGVLPPRDPNIPPPPIPPA